MNLTSKLIPLALFALIAGFFAWLIQGAFPRRINKSIRRRAFLLGLRFRQPGIDAPPGCAQFCNIGEGSTESGQITYVPDAATTRRYLLYKRGTGVNASATRSVTLTTAAADYPLGSSDDQADLAWISQGIAIKLFGAIRGTTRVISDGTIVDGSWVGPSGVTNGYATVATTGNCTIGKAIVPPDAIIAAGDPVEIIPVLPTKYAY